MARKKKILVTGGSGFVAKHIIRHLLDEGFDVAASLRDLSRASEVISALSSHVKDPEKLESRLEFVPLDLTSDAGWEEAMKNRGGLIHTASPFPMAPPKHEDDVILPAVDGTTRALNAALEAGVHRVVLTSSLLAIINRNLPAGRQHYTETDWTDVNSPLTSAYAKSKTLAEKAAWNIARANPNMKLTVINPGLVLGPALDSHTGTSLNLIKRMLSGKDPMVPRLGMTIADVRDVAQMHVRALQRPETAGNRYIGAERFMWMYEMALVLKAEYPERKIATRQAPDWVIRFLARFDPAIKGIVPNLGHEASVDTSAAAEDLGMEFIEARQAIRTSAAQLVKTGQV